MAKCPKCGVEVIDPVKSWSMIGKPDRSGEIFKLTLGLYKCTCSDNSFRDVIGKEKITLRGVFERNNNLEEQLMEATSRKTELEGIVKGLEEEKTELLAEVEALRAIPMLENRLSTLEWDILQLREEKKTLMDKLTTLSYTKPTDQSSPTEKPPEDTLSEATTTAPIEEPQCECDVAEFTPEEPMVQVPPEIPMTADRVETTLEKSDDPPQVEPITTSLSLVEETPSSETLAESNDSKDDIPGPTLEIKTSETTLTEAPPVKAPSTIVEYAEISQGGEVALAETSTTDNSAVELEETPLNRVQDDILTINLQEIAPAIEEHPTETPQENTPIEASIENPSEIPIETVTNEDVTTPTILEMKAEASQAEIVESHTEDRTPPVSDSVEVHVKMEERVEIAEAQVASSNDTPSTKYEDTIPTIEAVAALDEAPNEVTEAQVEEKQADAAPANTNPTQTDSTQAPPETHKIEAQEESIKLVETPIIS